MAPLSSVGILLADVETGTVMLHHSTPDKNYEYPNVVSK